MFYAARISSNVLHYSSLLKVSCMCITSLLIHDGTILWNNMMELFYGIFRWNNMFSIYYGAFKSAHAMAHGAELSVSSTADLSRPMQARRAKA